MTTHASGALAPDGKNQVLSDVNPMFVPTQSMVGSERHFHSSLATRNRIWRISAYSVQYHSCRSFPASMRTDSFANEVDDNNENCRRIASIRMQRGEWLLFHHFIQFYCHHETGESRCRQIWAESKRKGVPPIQCQMSRWPTPCQWIGDISFCARTRNLTVSTNGNVQSDLMFLETSYEVQENRTTMDHKATSTVRKSISNQSCSRPSTPAM